MPIKLSVGLSKKLGLPDYGSRGASCHVEFELPQQALPPSDLEAFHRQVKAAYAACAQAVNDELARQQAADGNGHSKAQAKRAAVPPAKPSNGAPHANGNGHHGHRASEKQLEYIRQLARQVEGLGVRRLDTLSMALFAKPLAELTSLHASGLIDTMKAVKAGQLDLKAALRGAVR